MRYKFTILALAATLSLAGVLLFSVTNMFAGTGGKGAGKGVTTTSVGNKSGPTVRDHRPYAGGGRCCHSDPNPQGGVTVTNTHGRQHGER